MKRKIIVGLIVAVLAYCVLAYIFMWPPVVRNYWEHHSHTHSYRGCCPTLREIDGAINQWALENHKTNGTPVTFEDIKPYIKLNMYGEIPKCQDGGTFSVTVVGAPPTCSFGTNSETARIRVEGFYWKIIPGHEHQLP